MSTTLTSKIRICKGIRLEKDYVNVLNYTESNMLSLCESSAHLVASANDYSFIRSRGTISVNFTYSQCLQSNYMAFQNKDYDNKWFFAFIDDVHYISDSNTEIEYTIDVWSTWFNKLTVDNCFVVREHVNDDTIGLHTVPENLDIGEVIEEGESEDLSYKSTYGFWIGVLSNWVIKDNSTGTELIESDHGSLYSGICVYNKNVFGNQLFLFEINSISDFVNLLYFIARTNLDGHIGEIQSMFVIPDAIITLGNLVSHSAKLDTLSFSFYTIGYNLTPETFNTEINKQHSFTGITVKNNKCFVYPYNYLFVSNNQGSNNIYKYEDFSTNKCVFENQLSMAIGISGRLVPKNYKGKTTDDDEALPLGKYPTCAWSGDAFTNWMTQNTVNIPTNLVMDMFGVASSYNSKDFSPISAGGSIAGSILNTIGQFYQASLLPNIQGGQATGDIIWAVDKNCFTFRKMRAKNEYMMIIDNYFTKFGYKVNRLKTPNITGRQYWNYIEIGQGEELGHGNIPNNYMETINNVARRGVTIWHSHDNIGNFSLNNTIL